MLNHAIVLDVCPPEPRWGQRAEREVARIHKALGCDCVAVHHVGATSIPNLPAVPVLDLIAEITIAALTEMHRLRLLVHGFSEAPSKQDTAVFRAHDPLLRHCLVEIMCYPVGHPATAASINFFAQLRQQPALAHAYDAAKRSARARHGAESGAYWAEKQAWVRRQACH